jgi:hypothetical protein
MVITGSSVRQKFIRELKRSSNPGAKTLGSMATKHWPLNENEKMLKRFKTGKDTRGKNNDLFIFKLISITFKTSE